MDKDTRIVYLKLKPFHFQMKTSNLSDANYQTDNPSQTDNSSLVWKRPLPISVSRLIKLKKNCKWKTGWKSTNISKSRFDLQRRPQVYQFLKVSSALLYNNAIFYQCFLVLSLDISQPEIMLNKSKLQTGKVSLLLSHFACRHATLLPKIGSQKERYVTTKKMAAYWTRKGCIKKINK